MGLKDPERGGVYSDCWHIPGGGKEKNETLEKALVREVKEEVGIDISLYKIISIFGVREGEAEKTLKESGERVLCQMEFNTFKVIIDKNADEIKLELKDDLVEAKWFSKDELFDVKQIPGGKEFFQEIGIIKK